MKPVLIAGTTIVTLALISYTLFILTENRVKKITNNVIFFLTMGVILDITATTCMIIGSENSPFTLHGILGYSSLMGMLLDTVFIWRLRLSSKNIEPSIPHWLHIYTRVAYAWWVVAFITGGVLVISKQP